MFLGPAVTRQELKLNKQRKLNQKLFSKILTDLAPWQEKGVSLQAVERTYCTQFDGGYVDGGFRLQVAPCLNASCNPSDVHFVSDAASASSAWSSISVLAFFGKL